jgi:hypothetical protein
MAHRPTREISSALISAGTDSGFQDPFAGELIDAGGATAGSPEIFILRVVQETDVEGLEPEPRQRTIELILEELGVEAMPAPVHVLHHFREGPPCRLPFLSQAQVAPLDIESKSLANCAAAAPSVGAPTATGAAGRTCSRRGSLT